MFFLKNSSILSPKLSRLFRYFLHCGEFPFQRRIADVNPIPKGHVSALVFNYWPILITKGFRKDD